MNGLLSKASVKTSDTDPVSVSLQETILNNTTYDEVAELVHESAVLCGEVEQAMVVYDGLVSTQASMSVLLESGSADITIETVVGANALTRIASEVLGIVTPHEPRVSLESTVSPSRELEISCEDMKNLISKVYRAIIKAFHKLSSNIKKLVAKGLTHIATNDKRIKALKAKWDIDKVTKTLAVPMSPSVGALYLRLERGRREIYTVFGGHPGLNIFGNLDNAMVEMHLQIADYGVLTETASKLAGTGVVTDSHVIRAAESASFHSVRYMSIQAYMSGSPYNRSIGDMMCWPGLNSKYVDDIASQLPNPTRSYVFYPLVPYGKTVIGIASILLTNTGVERSDLRAALKELRQYVVTFDIADYTKESTQSVKPPTIDDIDRNLAVQVVNSKTVRKSANAVVGDLEELEDRIKNSFKNVPNNSMLEAIARDEIQYIQTLSSKFSFGVINALIKDYHSMIDAAEISTGSYTEPTQGK